MSLPNINVLPLRLISIFSILINLSLPQVALFLLYHSLAKVPSTSTPPIPGCLMTLKCAEASLNFILLTQMCSASE